MISKLNPEQKILRLPFSYFVPFMIIIFQTSKYIEYNFVDFNAGTLSNIDFMFILESI